MDERTKYKIYSLVHLGVQPQQISDDLGVGISTVMRMSREFLAAVDAQDLGSLLDVDKLLIAQTAKSLGKDGKELIKGLDGLNILSDELQKTALNINMSVNRLVASAKSADDLGVFTSIICDLQVAFLNKNQTQVNVQNNFTEDNKPKYTQYMGDKPS